MKVICSGCHETMDPVEFNDHALKCTIPVREGESFEDYKKRSNQAKKRKGKGKLMPKMSERDFHHVSDSLCCCGSPHFKASNIYESHFA